jgi:hypothetical protein
MWECIVAKLGYLSFILWAEVPVRFNPKKCFGLNNNK